MVLGEGIDSSLESIYYIALELLMEGNF